MKILYHHRIASNDGQSVHLESMVAALRAAGHEVLVVGPRAVAGGMLGRQAGWVARLKALLPKAVYEVLELLYSVLAFIRLMQAVRRFSPDVVYERYNLHLVAGWMLKWHKGLPWLVEVNAPLADERSRFGGLALPRMARWAERLVWRHADAVLPVTRVLAEHVAKAGVAEHRITVIPNGIDEALFAAAPGTTAAKADLGLGQALVLGFTGFVREWHGMDRVMRWLSSADAPPNAALLVVGDGPARDALERLAHDLGIASRVRFTGVIERQHVPSRVAAFDIALQPAVVPYASPLKLFEYLALGKAIVAPRQPNIEEILRDGENACLFGPEAGGLERALTALCADAELRSRVARGAAVTVAKMGLTWAANARRVETLAVEAAQYEAAKRQGVPARL